MNFKKKLFCIAMSVILMVAISGCGKKGDTAKYVFVDYDANTESEMMIGAYWCPTATDENWQSIRDCGINTIWLDSKVNGYNPDPAGEGFKTALALSEKYGLKAIVSGGVIDSTSQETVDEYMDSFLSDKIDFSAYDSFLGINALDEPDYRKLTMMTDVPKKLQEKYPDALIITNLFANYSDFNKAGGYSDKTYREYIEYCADTFIKNTKGRQILSVDYYPLLSKNNEVRDGFLWTIELVTEIAQARNYETAFYLQSTYQGVLAPGLRRINYDTLSWQAYSYLAYGCTNLIHFLYYYPGLNNDDSGSVLLNQYGQKTPQWYYAEQLNKELLNFDHVFKQFQYSETMPIYSIHNEYKDNNNLNMIRQTEELEGVQKVSFTQDMILSSFADVKENKAYMLVNFADKDKEEEIGQLNADGEMTLDEGYNGAIVYYHGEKLILNSGDTDLSVKNFQAKFSMDRNTISVKGMEAGQGIFIIPTVS